MTPFKATRSELRQYERNIKGASMIYTELLETVKAKLPTRQAITIGYIQQRYHTLQGEAHKVIGQLQAEGLIGEDWDTALGGYPVVVKEGER